MYNFAVGKYRSDVTVSCFSRTCLKTQPCIIIRERETKLILKISTQDAAYFIRAPEVFYLKNLSVATVEDEYNTSMEHCWNDDRGKPKQSRKASATVFTPNPTKHGLVSNLGPMR
jgi:hypothetical protein